MSELGVLLRPISAREDEGSAPIPGFTASRINFVAPSLPQRIGVALPVRAAERAFPSGVDARAAVRAPRPLRLHCGTREATPFFA